MKQGGYLKAFAPQKKTPKIASLEVFVSDEGEHLLWIWRGEKIPVVETKKCKHIRTVTLSNGVLKVYAHIYRRDLPNSEIARFARVVFGE